MFSKQNTSGDDHSSTGTPGSRGWRRRLGATAAAGVLTTAVALAPSAAVAAPARLADSTVPGYGWSSGGWSDPYGSGTGWGNGWGSGSGSTDPGTSGSTGSTEAQSATDAQSRGVVLIDTQLYDGSEAAGTGIVLTSAGRVLTNYHVVEGSTTVKVTVASTGKTYTAGLVGADQSADVALLQLKNANGLATADLDNDQAAVGDDVTAVGNAGGTGTLSVADGSVTGLDQHITTESEGSAAGENLSGLIQTDADIVAGDSGGPLLDDEGEVVGIDTAASSGGQVQGYAIPLGDALSVVAKINSGTETAQVRIGPAAYLGVQVTDAATSDASQGYGSGYGDDPWGYGSGSSGSFGGYGSGNTGTSGSGAAVSAVTSGGPAAGAGIGAGDVITKVGSATVGSVDDLTQALKTDQPGDAVALTWTDSSGTQHTAKVTLGASPVN